MHAMLRVVWMMMTGIGSWLQQVEDLSLIEDVGNIWNHVPVAREWTPLDPK